MEGVQEKWNGTMGIECLDIPPERSKCHGMFRNRSYEVDTALRAQLWPHTRGQKLQEEDMMVRIEGDKDRRPRKCAAIHSKAAGN